MMPVSVHALSLRSRSLSHSSASLQPVSGGEGKEGGERKWFGTGKGMLEMVQCNMSMAVTKSLS